MDSGSKLLVLLVVLLYLCCSSSAAAYGAGKIIKADEDQIKKDLKELELEKQRIANPMRVETETKGFVLPQGLVGRYNASSLDKDGKLWKDLSSQGNDIKSANLKGTLKIKQGYKGQYVHGSKSDGFIIPHEIVSKKWTFFAIAKWHGPQIGRIFDSTENNWVIGWYGGGETGVYHAGNKSGTGKKGDWTTKDGKQSIHGQHAWIQITAQRDLFRSTTGQDGKSQATTRTTGKKGNKDPGKIIVNMGTEPSDWAIYEMLLFGKELKSKEIKVVEKYLIEKYLLTEMPNVDIKSGHGKIDGEYTHFDKTPWFEYSGTPDLCRRQAAKLGVKMWGHRNEKHSNTTWRNKCFFFENPVEVKESDTNDKSHIVGCTAESVLLENACKPKE